ITFLKATHSSSSDSNCIGSSLSSSSSCPNASYLFNFFYSNDKRFFVGFVHSRNFSVNRLICSQGILIIVSLSFRLFLNSEHYSQSSYLIGLIFRLSPEVKVVYGSFHSTGAFIG